VEAPGCQARFSEVVERAIHDGPQVVTRRGQNAVVIVAYRDFVAAEPEQDFKDFLLSIPRVGLEIKPSRRRLRRTELELSSRHQRRLRTYEGNARPQGNHLRARLLFKL
jgi:prevent-host-death family protein